MYLDLEQALETLNEGYQDGEDHFYIHEQRARGEERLSGGRSSLYGEITQDDGELQCPWKGNVKYSAIHSDL